MFWVSFFCVLSIWIIWDRFHEKFKKETAGLQLESFLKILKISWSKYCFCIHASLYLLYQYLEKKALIIKKIIMDFKFVFCQIISNLNCITATNCIIIRPQPNAHTLVSTIFCTIFHCDFTCVCCLSGIPLSDK